MWTLETMGKNRGERLRGYIAKPHGRIEGPKRRLQWPVSLEEWAVLGLATGTALTYAAVEGIREWASRRNRITLAALGLGALLVVPPIALEVASRLTYTPMKASEHAQLRALNAQLDSDYARRYNEIMAGLGVNSNAQSTPAITRFPVTGGQSPYTANK